MICAVPRVFATKVRGGCAHAVPGGRHTMTIGDTPGARIAGLLDVGAAGHGNCSATTSVPTATWMVCPFWDGVTVTVPCAVLGAEVGGVGGRGDDGVGRPAEPEVLAEDDGVPGPPAEPEGPFPPGTPVADPEADPGPDGVPVPVPDPSEELAETVPEPDAAVWAAFT